MFMFHNIDAKKVLSQIRIPSLVVNQNALGILIVNMDTFAKIRSVSKNQILATRRHVGLVHTVWSIILETLFAGKKCRYLLLCVNIQQCNPNVNSEQELIVLYNIIYFRCDPGLIPKPDTITGCGPECVVDPDCQTGYICQDQK